MGSTKSKEVIMLKKYIGDKAFYRHVFIIALPIIIQNGITNFVSLLDNIMVGQIGTAEMAGVSIVNQLLFVFYLCVFGATSGAGIFTAQFFGSSDNKGVRYTFRFKILVSVLLVAVGIVAFLFVGEYLINLFLRGEGDPAIAADALHFGKKYLLVMLIGLFPFAIYNSYASTLRETGRTLIPMIAGISAVLVNLALNAVLIFGLFGAPALGVIGAAVATVISRFVELFVVVIWTHRNKKKNPFIVGAYRSLYLPKKLLGRIIAKGMPLLLNESLWALGMTFMNNIYSMRSLDVVNALNINSTLYNMSGVVYLAMGSSVGIIIGQMLGEGRSAEYVKDANRKLSAVSVFSCLIFTVIMLALSTTFPAMYDTSPSIKALAGQFICIGAIIMPFNAYTHATYFTLRSGGQTFVTFLFDCCYVWAVCVPCAYLLVNFTTLGIVTIYLICQSLDIIKCAIGALLLHKGVWIRNIVSAERS